MLYFLFLRMLYIIINVIFIVYVFHWVQSYVGTHMITYQKRVISLKIRNLSVGTVMS